MVIDLHGPQGNAYALMAVAKDIAKQLDMNYHVIHDEMRQGDYKHLLDTFLFHFGEYVELENYPE
ncbi:MAG: hypothetical protein CBC05_01940 [Crocinitomicaceae bacterium TMED45]|nr:MAG: hypothetical protein CBC05_02625 [Crocinitomicaceae bacterium TMED45]OUU18649.1 MAG: hypothetical protein CBC05_01940 [Crocinitomicaceae bacterium TMED45]|tara:strand:- start:1035 stop:1229 length:195 start_codon:yes stop_codon:yes gene_type:complete